MNLSEQKSNSQLPGQDSNNLEFSSVVNFTNEILVEDQIH